MVGYNVTMTDARGKPPWTFYYDGDCAFCAASVRALAAVDLFRRVAWTDFQALPQPPGGLSWKDLDRAAWLQTLPAGPDAPPRLYRGFYAFRMLSLRLPPLLPLAPLLWLPGVPRLGEAAYRWVAANRYRISRGCGR